MTLIEATCVTGSVIYLVDIAPKTSYTHTHTNTHARTHARTHTNTHAHKHTVQTLTHTRTHARALKRVHRRTQSHTRAHTRTRARARTHTHTAKKYHKSHRCDGSHVCSLQLGGGVSSNSLGTPIQKMDAEVAVVRHLVHANPHVRSTYPLKVRPPLKSIFRWKILSKLL